MTYDERSLRQLIDEGWRVESAKLESWASTPDPPLMLVLTRNERQLKILPFDNVRPLRDYLSEMGVRIDG